MTRLRTRLVIAFVLVALLPAVPLSFVVHDLLERSTAHRSGKTMIIALEAGLKESRHRLAEEKRVFLDRLNEEWSPTWSASEGMLEPLASALISEGYQLDLFPLESVSEALQEGVLREAPPSLEAGDLMSGPVLVGSDLAAAFKGFRDNRIIVITRPLPAELLGNAASITEALVLAEGVRRERSAVLRSYILPFLLTYAVLIMIAVAAGTLFARRIARPLEGLVRTIGYVARGNFDIPVEVVGQGEVRELQISFNRMLDNLKEQRLELARLERKAAWRDLAQSLAHEIKNPLTPIQLAVQELGDRYGDDRADYGELLAECVEIVNEEVAALRNLVQEFSEFARLPEPVLATGALNALAGELVKLYGADRVVLRTGGRAVAAIFDHDELRRALINLIDNGLAACTSAGQDEKVELHLEYAGGRAVIRVKDRGCGIQKENLARIFEPHFSTKTDGFGLGLAIVEGIVNGHRGRIHVESEPGIVTEFTIELPVSSCEEGQNG